MFVSSYNTYIHTNTTDKTSKIQESKNLKVSQNFASNFLSKPTLTKNIQNTSQINYVNNAKVFNNQQKLQQDIESKQSLQNASKFNGNSALKNAKVAYLANSTMFSIVAKPKQSMGQVQTLKGEQESSTQKKQTAINTYLANDKYYQITA